MTPSSRPPATAEAWQISNPPIFSMGPVRTSLELFDKVGMAALRERSMRLTGYLESLLDEVAPDRPLDDGHAARPGAARRPALRARSPAGASELSRRLRDEHGVIADAREPDIVRLAPVPLYSTYPRLLAGGRRAAPGMRSDGLTRRTVATAGDVAVVGAGLAGCLLACFLARRGLHGDAVRAARRPAARRPAQVERGPLDQPGALRARPRRAAPDRARADQVMADALPMRGRMIHPVDGRRSTSSRTAPTAQRAINSISRGGAQQRPARRRRARTPGVASTSTTASSALDPATGEMTFDTPGGDGRRAPPASSSAPTAPARPCAGSCVAARARRRRAWTSSTTATRS